MESHFILSVRAPELQILERQVDFDIVENHFYTRTCFTAYLYRLVLVVAMQHAMMRAATY